MMSQSVSKIGNAVWPTELFTFISKCESTDKHPRIDIVGDSSSVCLKSYLVRKYVCMYV